MDCRQAQELILESAAAPGPEFEAHVRACAGCAQAALAVRQSMALLEEWQAPEPSPYFAVRLSARLRDLQREEGTRQAAWWQWWRKPAVGLAMAALLVAAVGLFSVPAELGPGSAAVTAQQTALPDHFAYGPGSAVADLQALERNHELFASFDLLDEMDLFPNDARGEF